jgi:hypothetical protein
MLLKVSAAMMLIFLVLTTEVVDIVALRSENPESAGIPAGSRAAEKTATEKEEGRKFDPGQNQPEARDGRRT